MTAHDRRLILPDNCHYCGHRPHTEACTDRIQTSTGKNPEHKDCPCPIGQRII